MQCACVAVCVLQCVCVDVRVREASVFVGPLQHYLSTQEHETAQVGLYTFQKIYMHVRVRE